jgi:hypothetical protein
MASTQRVDLAVESRAQHGLGSGAPSHPAVDQVQHERHGRERHQQHDRDVVREGVRDQRRDADDERGAGQRHPGRRADELPATPRQLGGHDERADDADDPPGGARPGRGPEDGQQQHLGEQAGRGELVTEPDHSSSNRGESA